MNQFQRDVLECIAKGENIQSPVADALREAAKNIKVEVAASDAKKP